MGRSLRLLVVEDHLDSAELLKELLQHHGHTVSIATSASAPIALADEHTFDVVVSDVGLPDATGYELMARLRERYQIKGIALSGSVVDPQRGRAAGFSVQLTKPVTLQRLQQALADVVE